MGIRATWWAVCKAAGPSFRTLSLTVLYPVPGSTGKVYPLTFHGIVDAGSLAISANTTQCVRSGGTTAQAPDMTLRLVNACPDYAVLDTSTDPPYCRQTANCSLGQRWFGGRCVPCNPETQCVCYLMRNRSCRG